MFLLLLLSSLFLSPSTASLRLLPLFSLSLHLLDLAYSSLFLPRFFFPPPPVFLYTSFFVERSPQVALYLRLRRARIDRSVEFQFQRTSPGASCASCAFKLPLSRATIVATAAARSRSVFRNSREQYERSSGRASCATWPISTRDYAKRNILTVFFSRPLVRVFFLSVFTGARYLRMRCNAGSLTSTRKISAVGRFSIDQPENERFKIFSNHSHNLYERKAEYKGGNCMRKH